MRAMLCLGLLIFSLVSAHPSEPMIHATVKFVAPSSTATGFFLTTGDRLFLVTAAHVLENAGGAKAELFLRRREEDGTWRRVKLSVVIRDESGEPLWRRHPDRDLAMLEVDETTLPERAAIAPIALETISDGKALRTGDAVSSLGFPHGTQANGAAFPILRRGAVASFPIQPVAKHPTFMVSFSTFAGDSGGPVFRERAGELELVGVVTRRHHFDEKVKTASEEKTVKHSLDLATAVHARFLRELWGDE